MSNLQSPQAAQFAAERKARAEWEAANRAASIAKRQAAREVLRTKRRAEQAVRDAENAAEQKVYVDRNNARLREQTEKLAAELKATARIAYIDTGGSPETFEGAWPTILERMLLEGTVAELKKRIFRREPLRL